MTPDSQVEQFELMPPGRTLLIFDGECVLCNSWVKFVLRHDELEHIYVTTRSEAQNSPFLKGQLQAPEQNESVIVLQEGKIFTHSDAAFMVLSKLDKPYSYLSIGRYFPRILRDSIYNFIARWRYKLFGKQEACDIEFQHKYANRFLKF